MTNNKLLNHFLIYLFSGGITKALPFIVLPIIATFLTPADFGLLSNFNVLIQLFNAVLTMKLMSFVQADYYHRSEEENKKMVSNLIYLALMVSTILLSVSFVFKAKLYGWLLLEAFWITLALFVAFGNYVFELRSTLLRLEEKPKNFALLQFIISVSNAGLTLFLVAALEWAWKGRVAALVVTAFLMLVLLFSYFVRNGWFPKPLSLDQIKELLRFGLPLLPHSITPFLRMGVDKIIITAAIGLAANGVYSFAATLAAVFTMLLSSFFSAYTPQVYKSLSTFDGSQSEKSEKVKIVVQGYIALLTFAVAMFIGFWVIRFIVFQWMNESYFESIVYLPWFLIDVFFLGLFQLFSAYVIYSKNTKMLGLSAFGSGVVQVVITVALVPVLGVNGAVYSMVAGSVLRFLLTLILATRLYPMPWGEGLKHLLTLQPLRNR